MVCIITYGKHEAVREKLASLLPFQESPCVPAPRCAPCTAHRGALEAAVGIQRDQSAPGLVEKELTLRGEAAHTGDAAFLPSPER